MYLVWGGVPGRRGAPGPGGGYLVPGGVPGLGGRGWCTWSWGGRHLVPGGCTWYQGGVPGPGGTWSWGEYLVPGEYLVWWGCTWSGTPPLLTELQTPVKT